MSELYITLRHPCQIILKFKKFWIIRSEGGSGIIRNFLIWEHIYGLLRHVFIEKGQIKCFNFSFLGWGLRVTYSSDIFEKLRPPHGLSNVRIWISDIFVLFLIYLQWMRGWDNSGSISCQTSILKHAIPSSLLRFLWVLQ